MDNNETENKETYGFENDLPYDDSLVDLIVQRQESAETARNSYELKWDRFYRLYRSYRDKKKYDYKANLFIPYTFGLIETEMPRLVSAMVNSPHSMVDVLPREAQDTQNARMIEQLLDYQLHTKINIVPKLVDLIKTSLIYGTAIAKVYWKKKNKKKKVRMPIQTPIKDPITGAVVDIETTYEPKEIDIECYNDPEVEPVDLFNFYVDPAATCIKDAKWVVHRKLVSIGDLKKNERRYDITGGEVGVYFNLDKIEAEDGRPADIPKSDRLQSVGLDDPYAAPDTKTKYVELLEYWEDDKVCVLANRKTIIRSEKNPYWHMQKPFLEIKDHPVAHEFYGIGEIEPIESLQREANDIRNQRMDNVNLVLNRMALIKRGSGINKDKVISQPGGIVWTNDMDALKFLDPPDVTRSSYEEVSQLERNIQSATGVTDYVRGMQAESMTRTASGINMMQQAASARFTLKLILIESMFLEPMAQMLISLDQQFMDKERMVRILGEKGQQFVPVTPDQIQGEFDFKPVGSRMMINRDVRRQQMLMVKNLFAQDPTVDQTAINKIVLSTFDIPNLDELLIKDPQQIMAQKMMLAPPGQGIQGPQPLSPPRGEPTKPVVAPMPPRQGRE